MNQKDKILDILNILDLNFAKFEFKLNNFYYGLTLNYVNIVERFKKSPYNSEDIRKILNEYNREIKTFNLSIDNLNFNDNKNEFLYNHTIDLVFHTEGMYIKFSSSNIQLPILEFDLNLEKINNMMTIYNELKNVSEKIHNII